MTVAGCSEVVRRCTNALQIGQCGIGSLIVESFDTNCASVVSQETGHSAEDCDFPLDCFGPASFLGESVFFEGGLSAAAAFLYDSLR